MVSGLRSCLPLAVFPPANRHEANFDRSRTVEYIDPAGAMPSSNVGAGNSRPWYVHMTAAARSFVAAGVGSNVLVVMPSGSRTCRFK
jgi:hypothetical protein